MSLFRSASAPAASTAPAGNQCVACKRYGTRLETRTLGNGEPARLCVDPVDCRRHWPYDDQPRSTR